MGGFIFTALVLVGLWFAWKRWGLGTVVEPPKGYEEEKPKRWNSDKFRQKAPEPSADDNLVANAPEPVDPIGYIKAKTIREMVKNITPDDKNWSAVAPSISPICILCDGLRIARAGVLICEFCDGKTDRRELETA